MCSSCWSFEKNSRVAGRQCYSIPMRRMSRRAIVPVLVAAPLLSQKRELRGRWGATDERRTLGGNWTAYAQPDPEVSGGTWTVFDTGGRTVAEGTWAVTKAKGGWRGNWRAEAAGGRVLTGSWTSSSALPASRRLEDLLLSALTETVSGTWRTGGHSGRWSIQTDAPK